MTKTTRDLPIPRHPMMAFAAGVFCPGLGLVTTGRLPLALVAVALWLGVYLVLPVVVVDRAPDLLHRLPSLVLAANAFVWFGAAIIAAGLAWRDGPRLRKSYEHPWYLVGFFVVVFVGFAQLRDSLLRTQVIIEPLWTTALQPAVGEGTLLITVRRGFDGADLRINDVVAVADSGPPFDPKEPAGKKKRSYARVIALPGSVVEVKDDGAIFVDGFPVITAPCPPTVLAAGRSCVHEKQATTAGTAERMTTATSFARAFSPTAVGPGQVFLLPDDRGRQLLAPAGLVSFSAIEGRVVVATR